MKSRRPYLIRALYDWIVDSQATPFILVKAASSAVVVPPEYVKDNQITLNIAPTAVRDLVIDDEHMRFAGRFAGQPFNVSLPLTAIGAIYARETGDGMLFETEEVVVDAEYEDDGEGVQDVTLSLAAEGSVEDRDDEHDGERRPPHLTVVK